MGRIFDEEFRVVRMDPAKARYVAILSDLYGQFLRIGNNYNQVVKAINTHLSHQSLPRQVGQLVMCTRELKELSERIRTLTLQLRTEWLHE